MHHGVELFYKNIDSLIVSIIYKVIKFSSFELFPKEIPADRNS